MARIYVKGYTKPDGTKVKGHYRSAPSGAASSNIKKNSLAAIFLKSNPQAKITTKKKSNGDVIVMVNGQTAYNKSDQYSAEHHLTAMMNALKRSRQ